MGSGIKANIARSYIADLANIIFDVIEGKTDEQTIECIGPEILSFNNNDLLDIGAIEDSKFIVSLEDLSFYDVEGDQVELVIEQSENYIAYMYLNVNICYLIS